MDARYGVRPNIPIADRIEVRDGREGEQELRVDAQLLRLVQMPLQVLVRGARIVPNATMMMLVVVLMLRIVHMMAVAAVIVIGRQIEHQLVQLLQGVARLRVGVAVAVGVGVFVGACRLLQRIIVGGHCVAVVGGGTANARARFAVVHHLLVLATQGLLELAAQINLVQGAEANQSHYDAGDNTEKGGEKMSFLVIKC